MLRELIGKLTRSLSERQASLRRRHTAAISVWFDPGQNCDETLFDRARSLALTGETVDLSRTGIAFLVSSIRDQEKYLVGQERKLDVEIELPSGRVQMQVMGRRYERVGIHDSTEKYLVGAEILQVEPGSVSAYERFLRRNAGRRGQRAHSLQMGID